MKSKIKFRTLVFIFVAVALIAVSSQCVSALGVAPAKKYVDYDSSIEQELSLKIINNENKDFKALIYVRGELADYITIENSLVTVNREEELKEFKITLKHPSSLDKPGEHLAEIVIMEFPEDYGENDIKISSVASVVSQIRLRVPYPGKYAEGKLYITNNQVGENVLFKIPVFNFGSEGINEAYAKIEIFGATYERIAEFETEKISIESGNQANILASWKADVYSGVYHVVATVYYDNKLFRLEQNFEVGDQSIDITSVKVENFNLGGVAKFDIYLKNNWNSLIKDVYGVLIVLDKLGTEYANLKTVSSDVEAFGEVKLEAYWNTEDVAPGPYNLDLTIHYGDLTTRKLIETEIGIDNIIVKNNLAARVVSMEKTFVKENGVLLLAVLILVIVNIGWFIYFRKKNK